MEGRFPEPWVEIRGRMAAGVEGARLGYVWIWELRLLVLRRRRESGDLLCAIVGDFPSLALEPPGDFARREVSLIQFLRDMSWFIKGCWYFRRRLGTNPLGESKSGLLEAT